jgi:phenylalanyl-tRNA synthetase beta chain
VLISLRWLARHVDLDGLDAGRVAEALTLHTAEVEGVERALPHLGQVVVGHVVERVKHPDADKLSLCRVDVGVRGQGGLVQIVCGAANVAAGQRVAVALPGTRLSGELVIQRSRIRGVESQGMICSERELGLSDEHQGIWVLPADLALGTSVAEALGAEDWVIEIDNKSLTHRPDLWGHRGLAAELAALFGRPLRPLDLAPPRSAGGAPYPVRVESAGCTRYLALPIDGVENGRSPDWMRLLLLAVGQRPLDLLVDLSNFVMLDLGQPNHLFDRARLTSDGILVRDARPGERMATLDGVERELEPSDVLICSGDRAVALAGVMGGEPSKVLPTTSELLLEVACFDPTRVRRTAARLGLRTDASARFEKSLDPTLPARAAAHLVNLLRELQPEIRLPRPAGDAGRWTDPAHTLGLRPARVRAVLGARVEDDEIERTLVRLGFGVERGAPTWSVRVPSARATKDVRIEEDLIEEVGRVHGYGNNPEAPLVAPVVPPPHDARRALVRRLQDRLAGDARFHEAMTHTFQSDELLQRLGLAGLPHVEVVNPIQAGLSRVRRAVLPGLLGVLAHDRRQRPEVRLFEVGKGYQPEHGNERGEPRETHELALLWAAPRPGQAPRFDRELLARLRGVVEDLFACAHVAPPAWRAATAGEIAPFAHAQRALLAGASGAAPLARLLELEPGVRRALGLTGELDCEVALAELSIDALLAAPAAPPRYAPLPRFPIVTVDVALGVPEARAAAELERAIREAGKGLVRDVELFDLFRGESLGASRKSLAYHVVLASDERTLDDQDAEKFFQRLERHAAELGGELRRG